MYIYYVCVNYYIIFYYLVFTGCKYEENDEEYS